MKLILDICVVLCTFNRCLSCSLNQLILDIIEFKPNKRADSDENVNVQGCHGLVDTALLKQLAPCLGPVFD